MDNHRFRCWKRHRTAAVVENRIVDEYRATENGQALQSDNDVRIVGGKPDPVLPGLDLMRLGLRAIATDSMADFYSAGLALG